LTWLLRLVVVVAVAALVGLPARPATAHASFVAASPAAGSSLPQAPGSVVLRFTEPLERALSSVDVLDSADQSVAAGPTRPVEGDPNGMRRPLELLTPDVYTVRWTTVSTLDGHSLHGSYTFGVGTSAAKNEQVAANPAASEGWLGLVGRWVALVGLVLAAGAALLWPRAVAAGVPVRRVYRLGASCAAIGTSLSLLSSALVATGQLVAVVDVVATRSGSWRGALVASATVAALWPRVTRWPARVLILLAVVAEAASGHAASTPLPMAATASFAVHLTAVGVWVFALLAAVAGSEPVVTTLKRFTRPAVAAAVVVALTGAANTVLELAEPRQLVTTAYGLVVVVKTVAFAAMATLGFLHYRRRRAGADAGGVTRPVRAELAIAVLALVLATVLVGFPNPPRQDAALAEAGGLAGVLDGEDALSLARPAGDLVVALSVVPPEPGPVELRVDVLGLEPGESISAVTVSAASDGAQRISADLQTCGPACFSGPTEVPAAGRWTFTVTVVTADEQFEVTAAAPLPAPPGDEALDEAIAAMEGLSSATVTEELRGAVSREPIVSHYTFEAPGSMRFTVEGGSGLVVIGDTAYRRSEPDAAWEPRPWPGDGFTWPEAYYAGYWARGATAARVLGTAQVDGVATTVLSVARPDVDAWFELYVGEDDGLVRRMVMTADGHLMRQTYGEFNAPVSVEPPISYTSS